MTVIVEVKLRGAEERLLALGRVRQAIRRGQVVTVGRRLAIEAESVLRKLTPRQKTRSRLPGSKRGHPPIWKQWERFELLATQAAYVAAVRNKAAETDAGRVILASLESGASEHVILPRNAKVLVWQRPRVQRRFVAREVRPDDVIEDIFRRNVQASGVVFAKGVLHPGHRPYHTVQRARAQVSKLVAQTLIDLRAQIERSFYGPVTIEVD